MLQNGCLVGEEVGQTGRSDGKRDIDPFRDKGVLGNVVTERFLSEWADEQVQQFLVGLRWWCGGGGGKPTAEGGEKEAARERGHDDDGDDACVCEMCARLGLEERGD